MIFKSDEPSRKQILAIYKHVLKRNLIKRRNDRKV